MDLHSSGYCLSLSGGVDWWITGYHDMVRWIDRLAAIMELEECTMNGSPKLIFSKKVTINDTGGAEKDAVPSHLDPWNLNSGWMCYNRNTIRIWYHNSIPDVICEVMNTKGVEYINMGNSLQPIYQRSISTGGLPFHAGLVELDGRGVLLSAPGGTGKSTCCRRLPQHWKPLCDDESLVVLDKKKKYRAHPFPTWSDFTLKRAEKTWNVQYSVPLCGIFFLEQSELDEAVPVGEGKAAVLMYESAAHVCRKFERTMSEKSTREFRRELFDNACEMARIIPAFRLHVGLHGRFWDKIEKVFKWQ